MFTIHLCRFLKREAGSNYLCITLWLVWMLCLLSAAWFWEFYFQVFFAFNFHQFFYTNKKMETREICVITILTIFNVCWGMMASLPVCPLFMISNISSSISISRGFPTTQSYWHKETMKAPLFPMEASKKGASGSQISPGEEERIAGD